MFPLIEQHAEESRFLWFLREYAVGSPHYRVADLVDLDRRVDAHVDAIAVAGESGIEYILSNSTEDAENSFVATLAAVRAGQLNTVTPFLIRRAESFAIRKGIVSAIGWSNEKEFGVLQRMLEEVGSEGSSGIALAGSSIRREPEPALIESALRDRRGRSTVRAARAIGECKLGSCRRLVESCLSTDSESLKFWSTWSLALLGDRTVGNALKSFVDFRTEFAHRAIRLVPRILPPDTCRHWLRELAQEEDLRRFALTGCGVNGDPIYIPTLIHQMSIPEYARVAGEAFSMITGVDLAYEDLDMDQPEDFDADPTEDPADENVYLDPDEDLPWPNAELVDRWWHEHKSEYQPGVRYLCGQPISEANCQRVLREGYQRQRISAAYELALMKPYEPLFEWRAPGWRQQEWLGLRRPRRASSLTRAGT